MINQLRSDYYVYCLYDKYGEVRYIGSGRGDRLNANSDRKQSFKDILADGGKVEEVCSYLSRIDAIDIENELLSLYRNQIINVNKRVRLLDYKFEYFDKFLELSDDSPTGLIWKVDISLKKRKGSIAGSLANGYFVVKIKNGSYQIHRVLYCLRNKTNLEHYQIINHIDFNPLNNSIDNLEVVTIQMNCIKKTGYDGEDVGVRFNKIGFEARIMFNGNVYYKLFKHSDYGFLGCKEAAIKFRRKLLDIITSESIDISEKLESLGAFKSKAKNIIGGIRHRPGERNCFEAYGNVGGVLKTKHFSIKKYGFNEAKRLAEEARQMFVLSNIEQTEETFN